MGERVGEWEAYRRNDTYTLRVSPKQGIEQRLIPRGLTNPYKISC